MKSKILLSIIAVFFTFSYAVAESAVDQVAKTLSDKEAIQNDSEKHKQVVEEYKKFLGAVPPVTRDEVREYRKAVTKINKEKVTLYKKLSQEAQDFLSKERQFKMKLPLKDHRTVATEKEQM
jgi:peptidoglycan hydrolase CwlO-like protein